MNSQLSDKDPAIAALRRAFLAQLTPRVDDRWHQDVMTRIRAGSCPRAPAFPLVEVIAWRVASLAAMLAIAAGIAIALFKSTSADVSWDIAMSKTSCEWLLAPME
jgi:hypothetical protein